MSSFDYPILDPLTLEPSSTGVRFRRETLDTGSSSLHLWYEYRTELTYDSTHQKVNATIYNYDGTEATTYTSPVTFAYDGNTVSVTPVNGVATIDFQVSAPGSHVVTTQIPKSQNGSVAVNV